MPRGAVSFRSTGAIVPWRSLVKPKIHPTYYHDARVVCISCGTTFETGSTKKELHVEVCSNCHPFFTGQQRIIDTGGQVERFRRRLAGRKQEA